MIIVDCEQMSPEWFEAKKGVVSASGMDNIITSTGKPSTQAKGYMNNLLADWMVTTPIEGYTNAAMQRGIDLEPAARSLYELINDAEVLQIGLAYKDDRKLVSCSPDGIIVERGLEIKCPAPHTHVEYLLADKLPTKYKQQVQGSMYVTGLEYWDFMSYHPEMPPLIVTVERDVEYIKLMDELVQKFIDEMLTKREKLKEMGEAA